MIIKVPLRLDIAGSYTDLPGYREKGGTHINVPLDYGVRISHRDVSTPTTAAVLRSRRDGDEFIEKMNFQVAQILNVPRVELMSTCDIEHGSGLGASSATVVGIVKYQRQPQRDLYMQP